METMEIVLLIVGGCAFIASFLIPSTKKTDANLNKELARNEIKDLIAEEMNQIKQQVDETVDEAVNYAMEKTERSLERISNEKIMAVNEYSDTVLNEINKNHQEVIFLYDMLNDKHTSLKKTVTAVEKKAKEAESIAQEAFHSLKPEVVVPKVVEEKVTEKPKTARKKPAKEKENATLHIQNSNEAILALHKAGRSKVQIAKELGLGVGEVELVIGLFKERKV